MGINQMIVDVMVFFMAVAAVDKCLGGRWGLADKMEEGLATMGPMTIPMVGMLVLAPAMGDLLAPVVRPVFSAMGADPAMFATALLACDMGGYPLAMSLADTPEAGEFAGCILGSLMGGNIVFVIPVGIAMLPAQDRPYLALGVLAGFVTIPVGCVVGGLVAGYSLSMVLHNTLPILLLSVLIILGLWKAQEAMIRGFKIFGRLIVAIATFGFAISVIQALAGWAILPGLPTAAEGIAVVGSVAIMLAGAYPFLHLINTVCGALMARVGRVAGIDGFSTAVLFAGLANIMPVLTGFRTMGVRGKIIVMAVSVSGSGIIGDHLGYIASVAKHMIFPMVMAKAAGALTAAAVAVYLCDRLRLRSESDAAQEVQKQCGGGKDAVFYGD